MDLSLLTSVIDFFSKVSTPHLNILFLLGFALFAGTMSGRIFQYIKIPQVVGYIFMGAIIGQSGFNFIDAEMIQSLEPLSFMALGIIGFMIGGEFQLNMLKKHGKQFLTILFCESLLAFAVVTLSVGFIGQWLFSNTPLAWSIALLLGSIGAATAPAATTDILWECKSKGPLTRTIFGIVAMDDALALFLFAIASSCVSIIMGLHDLDLKQALLVPVHEILGAITIGVVFGWVLCKILVKTFNEDKVLIISLGGLLLIVGLALTLHMDMILASMVAGTFISNKVPVISKKAFRIIKGITPPIYVLFFILVGAKLDLSLLNKSLALASLVYIVSRFIGKASGAWFGAKISKAELSVQKYLPFCLLSQAGVAIGLSIIAFNTFPNEIGSTIIAIITASTFVVQLIGPILTKYAITQAKEVGKDCSENDFLEINTAKDFMNPHPKCVLQKEGYTQIIHMFKDDGLLVYPVIDSDNKIAGLITIESLKHILMEASMLDLIVADDLMVPVTTIITPTTTAKQIKFLFSEHRFYGLPVIGDNEEFLGFIYAREFFSKLSQKFIEQVTP